MVLTTLGSMGWIPTRERQTCCYCLELENCDTLVVFDAGSGMARFAEPLGQSILKKYSNVLLFLSHYHLDHITGLSYLSFVFRDKKIQIAAPGKEVYGRSAQDILETIIAPPVFGTTITRQSLDLEISDLVLGNSNVSGLEIETILQQHSDPSLGIKVAGKVCYMTDTTVNENTEDFFSGCRLLLHESWLDNKEYLELKSISDSSPRALKTLSTHSAAPIVSQTAAQAGVNQLLLIHLNPAYDDARLKEMESDSQKIFKNCRLARDGENRSG